MARRPARGLCGCIRTWCRLHARRPIVCPHIADVLWRGRVAQQRSAGSLALLARADQTARVGAPPRCSRRGRGLAGLSPAGGPRLGRRSRLCHASTGKAARLAVDLDQAGTGFRYWLSPLAPCRQDTIPSPVMAHALRLLCSLMASRQPLRGIRTSNSALELGASLGHYHARGRLPVGAGQVIAPVGILGSKQVE